jgi:50S ribosomal subunit-associated GTPase HflX
MSSIDWQSDLNNIHDLHQLTTNCVKKVTEVVNKHAPLRKASVSKMKQFTKPWISNGLLTSIKTKQKLSNLLNHIKNKAKKEYYNKSFELYKNNIMEIYWHYN